MPAAPMTDIAETSPEDAPLDAVLAAHDATESARDEASARNRLGVWLRAGTVATDATAAACAVLLIESASTRYLPLVVPALALGWLVLLRQWGAYRRGLGYPLGTELKAIGLASVSGALLLLQLGPSVGLRPQVSAVEATLLTIGLFAGSRILLRCAGAMLRKRRQLVRRVLLVGDGPDAYELLENLDAWPGHGIEVVGVCADTTNPSVHGLPVLGLTRSCNLVARDLRLHTVILASAALDPHDVSKIHTELLDNEREVILAPNVADVEANRLSTRQLGGIPVLRLSHRENRWRRVGKRLFDLVIATPLIVVLTPLLVALALLVKFDSPGPAYFRQRRVGRNGTHFELWKFRTMHVDAESMLEALQNETATGNGLFKLRDDPRVTRVGRWLRRASLDELPQLWNVLLGEMSLVGPRPALPHEVAEFDDFTLRRLRVKPGITGLWQVSGRSDASFATYSRMDAFYAENWTLLGDLRILTKTIPVVFGSRGAY
ncbi:MAG TPA: sugar transferase [Gaiellaceae bacterium]|nr:sugar transferase [Gaiellaceae bacterium]